MPAAAAPAAPAAAAWTASTRQASRDRQRLVTPPAAHHADHDLALGGKLIHDLARGHTSRCKLRQAQAPPADMAIGAHWAVQLAAVSSGVLQPAELPRGLPLKGPTSTRKVLAAHLTPLAAFYDGAHGAHHAALAALRVVQSRWWSEEMGGAPSEDDCFGRLPETSMQPAVAGFCAASCHPCACMKSSPPAPAPRPHLDALGLVQHLPHHLGVALTAAASARGRRGTCHARHEACVRDSARTPHSLADMLWASRRLR